MRIIVRVLVAVTSVLTVHAAVESAVVATADRGEGTEAQDAEYVAVLSFQVSMSDFVSATKAKVSPDGKRGDTWFDWSSDLCSAPLVGNTGRTFNFKDSCRRHDFGYRNSQLLDRRYGAGRYWNGFARKEIDGQFLVDMKSHCRSRRLIDRPTCYSWAYTFYSAVRLAGG